MAMLAVASVLVANVDAVTWLKCSSDLFSLWVVCAAFFDDA